MKKKLMVTMAGALAILATLAFVRQQGGDGALQQIATTQEAEADPTQTEGAPSEEAASASDATQPIQFPHDVHVDQYQIDCRYCHYSADRSVAAGMPPVGTCMGCHSVVQGSQNPEEVVALRGYYERGEAIPWVRIYKVADHVHFPHLRHVSAGVDCATCHGQVDQLSAPVAEVNQPLSMGWCVSCHMERDVSRDCTVCHY